MKKKKARKAARPSTKPTAKKRLGRPPLGHACPLLSYGTVHRGLDDWRIVMAREPARVRLKQEHIDNAIPGSSSDCAYALAFADHFGPDYDVHINATVTKVISQKDKVELRLHTPAAIARKLVEFDRLHYWDMPPGIYRFGPVSKGHHTGSYARKAAKKRREGGNVSVVNNQKGSINRRVAKKVITTTRIITRNATVRWTKKKSKRVA